MKITALSPIAKKLLTKYVNNTNDLNTLYLDEVKNWNDTDEGFEFWEYVNMTGELPDAEYTKHLISIQILTRSYELILN